MSTQTMVVILTSMLLAAIGGLLYLAMTGSVWAIAILVAVACIFCLVLGYGLSMLQNHSQTAREQAQFVNNARENLGIMAGLQKAQNLQNRGIQQQIQTSTNLPGPDDKTNGQFVIEQGIFDHLGED